MQPTIEVTGLEAGIYSMTVTDADDCQAITTYTINNSSPGFTASMQPDKVTNCGNEDGSVEVFPSGDGYSYTWDPVPNASQMTADDNRLINLPPGGYEVTVTDAEGCTSSVYTTVSTNIPAGECVNVIALITRITFPPQMDI